MMIISGTAISQTHEILMTQSMIIDETIYENIKGSPYLFKDVVKADILDRQGNLIEGVPVNFNAYEHGMEVRKNGRLTILDETYYPKITIKKHDLKKSVDGPLVFVPFRNQSATNIKYIQEIAYSPLLVLYKKYRVAKKESVVNTPGEIVTQERFNMYKEYLLYKDGEYIQVKAKVDDFIKHIGFEKELKSFAKKNKIKFKTDQEAKEFIEYAISLQ